MHAAKTPKLPKDPDRTREDIFRVATEAFSRDGLAGARVDDIAELTQTSKRMIYYYFEGKEGLYRAVLDRCYDDIRTREAAAHRDDLEPEAALANLVRVKFDYHHDHPDFIRLVMVENINKGEHIASLPEPRVRGKLALAQLNTILDRGAETGVFRRGLNALDVHTMISALCFYNVSNRWTVKHILDVDMCEPPEITRRREVVVDTVLRFVRAE